MSRRFNPNEHKPDMTPKEGFDNDYLTTGGVFILVPVYFKGIDESRGGNPFASFKFQVLGGEPSGNAGKVFWDDVFLHPNAYARLSSLCASMGVTEPFDPDNADEVRGALLARPFKCRVKIEPYNGKKYAKLAFCQLPTDGERKQMDAWFASKGKEIRDVDEARRASGGGGGRRRRDDEDWNPSDDEAPPDYADDDIPF